MEFRRSWKIKSLVGVSIRCYNAKLVTEISTSKTRKVKVGYSPTANQIEADLAALLANL